MHLQNSAAGIISYCSIRTIFSKSNPSIHPSILSLSTVSRRRVGLVAGQRPIVRTYEPGRKSTDHTDAITTTPHAVTTTDQITPDHAVDVDDGMMQFREKKISQKCMDSFQSHQNQPHEHNQTPNRTFKRHFRRLHLSYLCVHSKCPSVTL